MESPQVRRRFEGECDELQWKLSQRRAIVEPDTGITMEEVEPSEPQSGRFLGPPSPPYSSHLIPAISITPTDPGLISPFFSAQPQNVEFVFEDVLDFWKTFEYVKVGSCGHHERIIYDAYIFDYIRSLL